MFTGIVEEIGTVASLCEHGDGLRIAVRARAVLEDTRPGDSISVDGVCQTVTALTDDGFTVEAVRTTLDRTAFRRYAEGRRVNLERAATLGTRLGGHLVQGHVDGVGEVTSVVLKKELTLIDFTLPSEVSAVTVLHGSITVNGVSLTVNATPDPGTAQVSIIPHTRAHTNLADLVPGDEVNVEADLIGKYVRKLLEPQLSGTRYQPSETTDAKPAADA